jgi:hypothetical protein
MNPQCLGYVFMLLVGSIFGGFLESVRRGKFLQASISGEADAVITESAYYGGGTRMPCFMGKFSFRAADGKQYNGTFRTCIEYQELSRIEVPAAQLFGVGAWHRVRYLPEDPEINEFEAVLYNREQMNRAS